MSELYRIAILSIQSNKVNTEITIVHPDAGNRFDSRDFALQILIETADLKNYWNHLPISKDDWKKSVENHPKNLEITQLLQYNHGLQIESTEEEYKLLRSDPAYKNTREKEIQAEYGFGISHYGGIDGQFYIGLSPDYQSFINNAFQIIIDKPIKTLISEGSKEKNYGVYHFEFEVVDSDYLFHLKEGMIYETAAFNQSRYYRYSP